MSLLNPSKLKYSVIQEMRENNYRSYKRKIAKLFRTPDQAMIDLLVSRGLQEGAEEYGKDGDKGLLLHALEPMIVWVGAQLFKKSPDHIYAVRSGSQLKEKDSTSAEQHNRILQWIDSFDSVEELTQELRLGICYYPMLTYDWSRHCRRYFATDDMALLWHSMNRMIAGASLRSAKAILDEGSEDAMRDCIYNSDELYSIIDEQELFVLDKKEHSTLPKSVNHNYFSLLKRFYGSLRAAMKDLSLPKHKEYKSIEGN